MKYLIILMSIIIAGCFNRKPDITGLEGKPIPSFKFLLTDSSTYFDTRDIPEGKPFVLFLFSPYCPHCQAEMSDIIENIDKLRNIRFYVFTNWPFSDMKKFYSHFRLNRYSNFTVGADYKNYFVHYSKAERVPYMAIYGKDKRLSKVYTGRISYNQIKNAVLN